MSETKKAIAGVTLGRPKAARHQVRFWALQILVAVMFIALSFAFLIPFYWMVVSSFKPVEDIFSLAFQFFPRRVTTVAYVELFTTKPFFRWFWNTFFMTAVHTAGTLLISAMAGYALAKYQFKGSKTIFLIILASTMIPLHLRLIPLFLTLNAYRLINTYTGVILPTLASSFSVFFMRQFMLGIDSDLLEAGRIDGASEFRLFWNIALPLSKPALSALGVLTALNFWNDLLWPLVVTRTPDMFPLAVGLASMTSTYRPQYHLLMAGSFLSVLPIIVAYFFARRTFTQGLAISSGLKG
ncbi:MAG: carbohydrate ABC transporter permease [Clostridia bacterium]